jgi:HTH-like domain/Integrase core domain
VSLFRVVGAEKADVPVSLACRVLGVSRPGFHAWQRRPPSDRELNDAWLTEQIREIYRASRENYGASRVHRELREQGIRVGRKRVERLMRAAGLSGYVGCRKGKTTIRVPGVRPAEDLVDRNFVAAAPNLLWMSDIKEIPTWEGKLYLATTLDCFSRKAVGWSIRDDMRADLVVDALEMAVSRRRPEAGGLVFHSDQGSQGEFDWSSQHLSGRCCDGQTARVGFGADGPACDALAGAASGGASGASGAVLGGDPFGAAERGCGARGGGVAGGRRPVVPGGWRDACD